MARKSGRYGFVAAAACVAAVIGVAGCGGNKGGGTTTNGKASPTGSSAPAQDGNDLAGLSAQQISDKAKSELLSATSLHIRMTRPKSQKEAMNMDLALDSAGDCRGTIAMGGSVHLVKVGDRIWMKPDDAFWTSQLGGASGSALSERFKGKYLYGTENDDPFKDFAGGCNLKDLQKQMSSDTSPDDVTGKGELTTVDGQQAVPVYAKDSDGKTTIYVAAQGKPRPLKIVGGNGTVAVLSDWNKQLPTDTPPQDQTVDVSKLGSQLQGL